MNCPICNLSMMPVREFAAYSCHRCKWMFTEELLENASMAIIRGQFSSLLAPGLKQAMAAVYPGKVWDCGPSLFDWIEQQDKMAILHPDTSAVPIWRRPPTRLEHPISAWRCWGIIKEKEGWILSSVSADCLWEGPVLRAHKRPVDPKYWDAKKTASKDEYFEEMHDTFELAGIYALKTKTQAIETAFTYSVNCIGEVALYGRVAQFKLGYRAEACMIKRLLVLDPAQMFNGRNDAREKDYINKSIENLLSDLSRRYGCEVGVV